VRAKWLNRSRERGRKPGILRGLRRTKVAKETKED
jgi:hypothetical protein